MNGYNFGQKKVMGWKRCEWFIESRSVRTPSESTQHKRTPVRTKGERCKQLLSPNTVRDRGVCICGGHMKFFLADVERREGVRLALRRKYDPGPLPLDGEEAEG